MGVRIGRASRRALYGAGPAFTEMPCGEREMSSGCVGVEEVTKAVGGELACFENTTLF